MVGHNGFLCFNIREFLQQDKDRVIGEDNIKKVLSDFICPINKDVENFLRNDAVEFTKKNQSVTYLVLSEENGDMLGYFTLTIKPITANPDKFSNTVKRKLLRVGEYDEDQNMITLPAYLIAQLGRNFDTRIKTPITGVLLLKTAMKVIEELQYDIGGMVVFLEAEDNDKLRTFYIKENGYKEFKTRKTKGIRGEPQQLIQMLKVI